MEERASFIKEKYVFLVCIGIQSLNSKFVSMVYYFALYNMLEEISRRGAFVKIFS